MARPGPNKGEGGRPRKKAGTNVAGALGYKRVTVGAKSKGKQVYEHRVKAGVGRSKGPGGPGTKGKKTGNVTVVHHKDGNSANNARSNLQRMKRKEHPKHHAKG
jgi:hypothetical protein